VIAAFLGVAHHLSRHRLTLPARLGVNIVRETNGYTYSQTVQGKTVFTIHAAKAVEHSDSKIALRDVSIALYGAKQERNDRIYGDEFEYDQKAGVVRATGLVHIDLQAAEAAGGGNGGGKDSTAGAKVLHVTTRGLVYLEDLGVAATNEVVEFQSGAMKGHATGASFSRDSGLLMLHSAVSMSGMMGKRAVTVTAATANLDNPNQEIYLTNARCDSQEQTVEAQRATLHTRPDGTLARVEAEGDVTMQANGATVVSERADVALNAKSQPQSVLLTGGVRYSNDQPLRQMRGEAQEATIAFDTQATPQPEDAVFTGAVHMTERTRATQAANEPWSTRDLTAAKVEARLARTGAETPQLRDVDATGSARLVVVNSGTAASTRGVGRTELAADDLKAHWIDAKDGRQPPRLDTFAGRGHTLLHQVTADGIDETSSGDLLDAKFRPGSSVNTSSSARLSAAKTRPAEVAVGGPSHAGAVSAKSGEGVDDLLSAVQQGHITMIRRAPEKSGTKAGNGLGRTGPAQEDLEQATADRAAYDGDLGRVTLTGGVEVSDRASALWAGQVVVDRKTGDAHALGAVKVNYLQDNSAQAGGLRGTAPGSASQQAAQAEPTHVLAERAELVHATSVATFYGRPVRMWQGGSQVQAPVIELQRAEQRMIARGVATAEGSAVAQVHTVLMNAGSDRAGPATSGKQKAGGAKAGDGKAGTSKPGTGERLPGVVRIASGGLVYSGDLRQAVFTGAVRAETVDGTIRAREATVYLQQAAAGAETGATGMSLAPSASNAAGGAATGSGSAAVPSLAGNVERMVAIGQVAIEQPGRRATGERLVYTASDGLFVLTGDDKAQPKLVDAARGTITGAALLFHAGDDRVVVSNVAPGGTGATGKSAGQPVRSETRAGKDATMGKGK
jgi:lipopolysaccharide export system protein LptA